MAIDEIPFEPKVLKRTIEYDQSEEFKALTLNRDDPFEKILHQMVLLQRRKANDYASDDDKLKNMREVVSTLGIEGYDVVADCEAMVIRKTARINNLRGREPSNESLRDSYLDRAIYAILAIVALDER